MTDARAPRARRPRGAQASLAAIVLGLEFVVVPLAALVVFGLHHDISPVVAFGGGGALLALILVALTLTSRSRAGIALGWVVQVLLIAAAFVDLAIGIVGVVFLGFWLYCMIVGARLDRRNAR